MLFSVMSRYTRQIDFIFHTIFVCYVKKEELIELLKDNGTNPYP